MNDIKGAPTDEELEDVDWLLMTPGWINLLDHAGLSFRHRQVIGWALRMAPRFRECLVQIKTVAIDNAIPTADQRMALDFVRQVAEGMHRPLRSNRDAVS